MPDLVTYFPGLVYNFDCVDISLRILRFKLFLCTNQLSPSCV